MQHQTKTGLALFGVLMCIAAFLTTIRAGLATEYPVSAFANLPNMEFPALSPDGRYIAFLRPVNGRRALFVGRRGVPHTEARHLEFTADIDFNIDWFRWVSNRNLVVATNFTGKRNGLKTVETRLVTASRDGSFVKSHELRRGRYRPQVQTDVIDFLYAEPNQILVSMETNSDGRIDAFRLNTRSGRLRTEARGTVNTHRWVTDHQGLIRIRIDVIGTEKRVFLRQPGGSWRILRRFDFFDDPDFQPHGFIDYDTLYVVSTHENDRRGLYTFSISQNEFKERLFLHEDVDVLSLGRYRDGKIWGVQYATDHFATKTLEPDATRVHGVINRLLPNTFNFFLNHSDDKQYYIFYAATANDPGTYYLYDDASGQTSMISRRYPILDPNELGRVAPFKFKARDGLEMSAYVTLPAGARLSDTSKKWPVVVMPHGGPRSRDYPSFDYAAHFLANRGYAVLQINFRGSLGYGRAFEALGFRQWGGTIQEDITDGYRALVATGFAAPSKACILGGSFGGYSALMGAVRWPALYRCAISLNGATDLLRFARFAKSYRFSDLVARRLGDPIRDARLLRDTSPVNLVDRIRIPVLLIHAENDRRVTPDHSQEMYNALVASGKRAELLIIPGSDHGLSRSAYRTRYLSDVERFLEQHLPR